MPHRRMRRRCAVWRELWRGRKAEPGLTDSTCLRLADSTTGWPYAIATGKNFSLKFSQFLLLFSYALSLTTWYRLLILRDLLMGRGVS
jgi:hypothetical protein